MFDDPRRRQERRDASVIHQDNSAMANLPQQAMHHEYPKAGYYMNAYIDNNNTGSMDLGLLDPSLFALKKRV